uniref:(California timema) hypothetical protein n=1 Tax=Timema californicum TaxID=61474 RepID=A0A7R9P2D8_TIMCA|nr:unnamed protein product [Timema californicum]
MEGKYFQIILKRNLFLALREFRKYATKPSLSAVLENNVVQSIENSTMKPKGHPGIMKTKPLKIPSTIENSIQHLLQDKPIKSLLEEAATLARHLHGRHPPKEEHELKILSSKVEQDIDSRSKIDISVLSEESRKHVLKIKQKQVRRRFHECVYHWKPIPYNHHKGLLYLLGRSAAEFAVLLKIFSEMKQRLPNLAPRTIFDFGSGVGTTTW